MLNPALNPASHQLLLTNKLRLYRDTARLRLFQEGFHHRLDCRSIDTALHSSNCSSTSDADGCCHTAALASKDRLSEAAAHSISQSNGQITNGLVVNGGETSAWLFSPHVPLFFTKLEPNGETNKKFDHDSDDSLVISVQHQQMEVHTK
eukprot:6199868-Pleurochrysis_carterae.AAC.3